MTWMTAHLHPLSGHKNHGAEKHYGHSAELSKNGDTQRQECVGGRRWIEDVMERGKIKGWVRDGGEKESVNLKGNGQEAKKRKKKVGGGLV